MSVHELPELEANDTMLVCVDVTGKSNEAKEFDLVSGNPVDHLKHL